MTSAASLRENSASAPAEAMEWESRAKRTVFLYVPLACFVLILLFPFYWMTITAFKPNAELYSYKTHNPFWIAQPTLDHIRRLLFETSYPRWLWTTMTVAIGATFLSLLASVLAAYAIQRLRFRGSEYVGLAIYLGYLVPPSILFIPLSTTVFRLGLFDTPMALILVYPTFLVPFSTWLLIGYFKSIPYEMEECALDRRRNPPSDPQDDHAAARDSGPDQRGHLFVHAILERVHLCPRFHSEQRKKDRSGRYPDGTGVGRRLPMGSIDGRVPSRIAAGCYLLLLLC